MKLVLLEIVIDQISAMKVPTSRLRARMRREQFMTIFARVGVLAAQADQPVTIVAIILVDRNGLLINFIPRPSTSIQEITPIGGCRKSHFQHPFSRLRMAG